MPLLLAAPVPCFAAPAAEERLAALCVRWERSLAPRLSPAQMSHCRRFGERGQALKARVSRVLARLLALRALPEGCALDMDGSGRPRVEGAPGWHVAFSHSDRAAFCLVAAPGERAERPGGRAALDAEAAEALPSTDRVFPGPAPSSSAALRRWLLAEALFKALGAAPENWKNAACAAHAGAILTAGGCTIAGAPFSWRILPAPGHAVCAAFPAAEPCPASLRWLPWQIFL